MAILDVADIVTQIEKYCCKGVISNDQFKAWAIALLAQIAIAGPGGGGGGGGPAGFSDVITLPLATLSAATIAGSAAYQVVLTDTHDKVWIQIYNGTDEAVRVSLDAAADQFAPLNPNSYLTLALGAQQQKWDGNVYVKRITAPTAGQVEVSAYY